MELRHIRYFVAVAEELDITKAAMRLNVSQPPLSRQIRDLEDELGMVLLERSPKEVRLTHAGGVFFKDAHAVLRHAAEAVRKARAIPRAKAAELRIGYAPSPTGEILPRFLRAFQRGAPRACVQLLDQSTEQSLSALSAGTIDVALVVQPPLKGASGLVFEKLLELPVGIIVPPEHPFARRRCVTLDEALCEPLVAYIRKGYADYHHWLSSVLNRLDANPASPAQWTERSASSPQWKLARESASLRAHLLRSRAGESNSSDCHLLRRRWLWATLCVPRTEARSSRNSSTLSNPLRAAQTARREQRSQTSTCLELPRPLPC